MPPSLVQAKQGFGLVEGHASVEDLIEEVGFVVEAGKLGAGVE